MQSLQSWFRQTTGCVMCLISWLATCSPHLKRSGYLIPPNFLVVPSSATTTLPWHSPAALLLLCMLISAQLRASLFQGIDKLGQSLTPKVCLFLLQLYLMLNKDVAFNLVLPQSTVSKDTELKHLLKLYFLKACVLNSLQNEVSSFVYCIAACKFSHSGPQQQSLWWERVFMPKSSQPVLPKWTGDPHLWISSPPGRPQVCVLQECHFQWGTFILQRPVVTFKKRATNTCCNVSPWSYFSAVFSRYIKCLSLKCQVKSPSNGRRCIYRATGWLPAGEECIRFLPGLGRRLWRLPEDERGAPRRPLWLVWQLQPHCWRWPHHLPG